MNVGDIVYWDSFGLEKPLLIVEIREEQSRVAWATVIVLTTDDRYDFCLCNLRTWEQMQGW
jgi:hypothetical protein